MKSRKFRNGTKKWKQNKHKTKEWFINQYGNIGIPMWERKGR